MDVKAATAELARAQKLWVRAQAQWEQLEKEKARLLEELRELDPALAPEDVPARLAELEREVDTAWSTFQRHFAQVQPPQ